MEVYAVCADTQTAENENSVEGIFTKEELACDYAKYLTELFLIPYHIEKHELLQQSIIPDVPIKEVRCGYILTKGKDEGIPFIYDFTIKDHMENEVFIENTKEFNRIFVQTTKDEDTLRKILINEYRKTKEGN